MKKFSQEKNIEKGPSSTELWDEVLSLFGTDEAKEKFIDLCRRYYSFLVKAKAMAGMGEQSVQVSETSRANIHNKIMTTVYSLMTQTKLSPERKKKLNTLSNRRKVAEMIDDVFGPQSPAEKEKTSKMTQMGRFRKGDFD
ncbi:MAG: hypothetical protein COU51_01715 [Parcubacteria group bacterium CG10_big_fil_rev_8_21_14_0_10_36_14]|nr:MAG: hypothetical protein COU51_01715 [Parcubacteria group bacterium CG10_big_fil_rev_8_21_14_0_10_36_14]